MSVRSIPLHSLCQIKHGGTPSKANASYWQGDIPWVSPKDMKNASISETTDHISTEAVANSATSIVPQGTILVVVRSGILVHTLPVAIVNEPTAFNQDIKALIPDTNLIEPDYLYWFVRSSAPLVLRQGVKKGATVHSLQGRFLEELIVPLPARPQQRRIIDLLSRADGIVRLRREAQEKATSIIPALFIDMFGDPTANPKGWTQTTLGNVVNDFRYGTSQKSGTQGLPTLRIPNIIGNRLDPSDIKLVAVSEPEAMRLRLRNGDVLFVRTNGNQDYVGRSAVYESGVIQRAGFEGNNCLYASYLIRARLSEALNPTFLQAFLSSSEGRKQLRDQARTSAGQYNINIQGIASVRCPLPPIERQFDFETRCRQLLDLLQSQAAALTKANSTFNGLLAEVFSTGQGQ